MAEKIETIWMKLKRDFNILKEGSDDERKVIIKKIYMIVIENKSLFAQNTYEDLMKEHLKTLLENISHKIDFIREYSLKLIHIILPRCQSLHNYIPYIITTLWNRCNCEELSKDEHLPEEMRPTPSQKPHRMRIYKESVEEIRFEFVNILEDIVECCEEEIILEHLQDIVDIFQCLLLDGFRDIQIKTCELLATFVNEYKKYLVHFGTALMRALLNPLVNKKGKVKKAAFKSLKEILYIGSFKQSTEIMEIFIGYRDPNFVAIKDFYEQSFNVNYLALLIGDTNVSVREEFYLVLEDWILNLPDREDHYSRIFPYLLSGLFDESNIIKKLTVDILEELGKNTEREKEKTFREEKQLGLTPSWSYQGRILNQCKLYPFDKRVRIGTRYLFQNYMTKFINPLLTELKDSIYTTYRFKAIQLLKFIIFLTEDQIVEYLNRFISVFIRNLKFDEEKIFKPEIQIICFLLGRYNDFESLFKLFKNYFHFESDSFEHIVFIFKNIFRGFFESVPDKNFGLGYKYDHFITIINFIKEISILDITKNEIALFCELIENIFENSCTEEEKYKLIEIFSVDLFKIFNYKKINLFYKNVKSENFDKTQIIDLNKKVNETNFLEYYKTSSQIYRSDSFDYKILLYLFLSENEKVEYTKNLKSIIKNNKLYYDEQILLLFNYLQVNQFVNNLLKSEEVLFFFFDFISDFFIENKKEIVISNDKKSIYELIMRVMDITIINKNNEKKDYYKQFLLSLLKNLNKSFSKIKKIEKIMLMNDFVKKIIKIDHFFDEIMKDLKQNLEIFLNKILLCEETHDDFSSLVSTVKIVFKFVLEKKFFDRNIQKEFFMIFFKIYTNTKNVNYKKEYFCFFKDCLLRDRILLGEMMENAQSEQRLERLDFLKKIWYFKEE